MSEEVTYTIEEKIWEGYWSVWVNGSDGSCGHGCGESESEAYLVATLDAQGISLEQYEYEQEQARKKRRYEKFEKSLEGMTDDEKEAAIDAYHESLDYEEEMRREGYYDY